MTATRNNLRAATAALSGAAIILLAAILLAIRPVPAFAEGGQVVLDMPTDVPCAVKADGSVVAPSPEAWTINNTSGAPVILGGVTIAPGTDAGPIGLSASATPYNGNAACGDPFDWFSYGRGQDADRPSAEQTLEAGDSLRVAWSIDKLDSIKNRKAIDGSTNADGFALASIQFSFKKKGPEAFAVFYDDGNGGRAAKLYKRYDVPTIGDVFEDDAVTDVITGIENKPRAFDDWGAQKKLTAVAVVDDGIQPLTMQNWFSNCSGLVSADLGKLDPSKTEDMSSMFYNCSSLTELDLSGWNTDPSEGSQTAKSTKNVKNMAGMFTDCSQLVRLNIPNWKTDEVTDMKHMFRGCRSLEELDVSNWNTEKVTNLENMFCNCYKLGNLDVSKWNTGKVTDMWAMFMGCRSITSLDMSNWDVSGMQRVESAFHGCTSLVSLDLSNWNLENCEYVGSVFSSCYALRELNVSNWSTGNVKGFSSLFYGCKSLTAIDVSKWDISKVSCMTAMFSGCSSLTSICFPDRGVLTETASGVQEFSEMFKDCSSLTAVDLSGVVGMSSTSYHANKDMFNGCNELKQVTLREQWPYEFSKCSLPATMYVKDVNGSFAEYTGGFPTPKTDTYYTEKGIKQAFAVIYDNGKGGTAAKLYKRVNVPAVGDEFEGDKVVKVIEGIENQGATFIGSTTLTDVEAVDPGIQPQVLTTWFYGCSNLQVAKLSNLDTSKLRDAYGMFTKCFALKILELPNFDTPTVENMGSMFEGCSKLETLDLSGWDTSKVTNMRCMFFGCSALKQLNLSGKWNASSVTNMERMFDNCKNLTSLNLSNFDTSNVTRLGAMFFGCTGLTSLDLSRFDTRNVTYMSRLFESCNSLESLDLSNWDTSKVAEADEMFKECSSLKWVALKQGWQFPFASCGLPEQMYVKNSDGSFAEYTGPFPTPKTDTYYTENPKAFAVIYDDGNGGRAAKLYKRYDVPAVGDTFENDTVIDVITGIENLPGAFKDNGGKKLTKVAVVDDGIQPLTTKDWFSSCQGLVSADLGKLDPSKTEDMSSMFSSCSSLTELDLSGWNADPSEGSQTVKSTKNVKKMSGTFGGCKQLTKLDIPNWKTDEVTDMQGMFAGCESLEELDVSNWNTAKVTTMRNMFVTCHKLNKLDVSKWNTGKVTDMWSMFLQCSSITSLDMSDWDVSGVSRMEDVFGDCSSLVTLDLSNWNTENFTSTTGLFNGCSALRELNVSNWRTGNITYFSGMFRDCKSLTAIDVSNWDISKATDMSTMFSGCSSLNSISFPDKGVLTKTAAGVKNFSSMFEACSSLTAVDLSGVVSSSSTSEYDVFFMFNGCNELKQVSLREQWPYEFSICELPATMYVKDGDGSFAEYRGGFPTPKTDTYYTEKLTPKAFAVIYHDGNNQKAAKLYKRGGVPKPGDIFDGVKVDAVKESIEESEDLFAESSSESDRLTSVGVADDGIQPLNMSGWFNGCSNLVNVDLGRLDTSQVSNMSYVFDTCESLTSAGISSISGWNTKSIRIIGNMFLGCNSLTSLDLSKWNTENVTFLNNMFGTCPNLTSLNLSGWNTKQVNLTGSGVSHLFEKCNKLDSITLGQNWNLNLYECGISTSVKFYDRDTGEVYNPKNAITKTVVYTTIKPATVSQSSIDQLEKDAAPADVSSGVAPRKSVDVELISDQASNAVVNDDASSVVMPSSEDARHVDDAWVEGFDSGLPAENTDVVDTGDQDDRHKAIEAGLK